MRKGHHRPRNEQDFEELCLRLLQAHWKCPELELYGSRGQAQSGVDLIDIGGRDPLRAAQCKLHEEGQVMTPAEVEAEIQKARGFRPPLGRYAIMTTAKARKEVHDLLITINRRHKKKQLFTVVVFDWRRIEGLLDTYPDVRAWYEGSPTFGMLQGLESRMDQLLLVHETRSMDLASYRDDQIHGEIDEARDYLRRHDYQMAKLLLRRLKERKWDELSSRHKFRILSNLATVELVAANHRAAADLFLKAKEHQPEEEVALTNEAFAHLLLGHYQRAFERTVELRNQYPRSSRLIAIYVKSAPDSRTLESIQEEVPRALLQEDEVAGALAERALDDGNPERAENYARTGTAADSREPGLWLLLGRILLQSEVSKSRSRYGETLSCDEARIREAEEALDTALVLAKERQSTDQMVEALINRRIARLILQKEKDAYDDLQEALGVAPQDPMVLEAQGESLHSQRKPSEAIDCLRRVPAHALSPHGHLFLAVLLLERADAGDLASAAELATELATGEQELGEGLREDCIEIAFQAFVKDGNPDAGKDVLARVPKSRISRIGILSLTGKLHLLRGHQDIASKYADKALAAIGDETTAFDLRRLATLCSELGRYAEALPLWQRIALTNLLSSDTRNLLECASRLRRHGVMLDAFRNLRSAGQIDRETLDHELALLEIYDTDRAISVLSEEITKYPQDRGLKLRRSWLGLCLDRHDLVDKDPNSVPEVGSTTPADALQAVHVLKAIGEDSHAVQYAYEVMRHNIQAPDAHRALLVALGPFGRETRVEKPTAVGIDTAVCYLERRDSTPRWIIVESNPDCSSQLPERELGSEHEMCKAMMGKKVGDTFVLAKGIQDRIGEIKDIQDKHVYRLQQSMGQWQVNFPSSPDVQIVDVERRDEGLAEPDFDFSAIIESARRQHEDTERVQRVYRDEMVPLHVFGDRVGKTAFDAILHLATSADVTVRCCSGSTADREHGERSLQSCNTLVLDMSAIGTLCLLDMTSCLEDFQTELVVSQGTVNVLRQMVANEGLLRGGAERSGVLIRAGQGVALVESTPEQIKEYIDSLRGLIATLERCCGVESCERLAEMEPSNRGRLVEFFGQYGAEAMVLSALPGRVLWSDDFVQAQVARSELGTSRVWTQFVLETGAAQGEIRNEAFLDASARLTGFRYSFTSQSPETILHAGVLADWKVDLPPFSEALASFGEDSVDLMQIVRLAAGFLKLMSIEPILAATRAIVTVAVLENIIRKEKGLQGIHVLHRALPVVFGVNVIGQREAAETIESWLRSLDERPLGV